MSKKTLKQRFREWQATPFKFKRKSTGTHRCANCGAEYEGDFCPECGQEYDVGPVDWSAIKEDIFSIVGLKEPSSIVMYVMQLLGRPGYLLDDYINGRRKVCDSPLDKLGAIAVGAVLVLNFTHNAGSEWTIPMIEQGGFFGTILGWLNSNLNWAILIQTFLLILPTWLLFRHAPRNSRHNLPKGLYIQVFMSSLVLIVMMLRALFGNWALVLIPIYYYIAYRQLFGYGVWGTLWRTFLCLGSIMYFFGVLMFVITRISKEFWADVSAWEFLSMFGLYLILGVGILLSGWWIGKRTEKPEAAE